MTSHTSASAGAKGSNRTKRCWTDEEDALLIQVLLELHSTGKYKADRGFKHGLFQAVEREFAQRLPQSGIRADPHIYSRVKTLKSHFFILYDMLYGSTSGFGWDPIRKCVVAEKSVWDAYLQSHKSAAAFKDKSFRYFDELTTIFGVDRANGNGAMDCSQADEEVERYDQSVNLNGEEDFLEHIATSASQATFERRSPEVRGVSRKRKASTPRHGELVEVLKENAASVVAAYESCTQLLCNALTGSEVNRKRAMLNGELKKLGGLTPLHRFKAYRIIGTSKDLLELLFGLPEEDREEWVRTLHLDQV